MPPGRYQNAEVAELLVTDGAGGARTVRYLRRRQLLDPASSPVMAVHRVETTDRLDLIAARYLGDPLAAWQLADANLAQDPDALTGPGAAGELLVVPMPQVAP